MDWIFWFELLYILSAVMCAVSYPINAASERRGYGHRSRKPLRFYLTYGDIAKGILFSIVPGLNTYFTVAIIVYHLEDISVFKEPQ